MYTILAGHREISTIRSVDPVIAGDVLPAPNTPLRPIGRMNAGQEAGASSGAPSLARANVNENTTLPPPVHAERRAAPGRVDADLADFRERGPAVEVRREVDDRRVRIQRRLEDLGVGVA